MFVAVPHCDKYNNFTYLHKIISASRMHAASAKRKYNNFISHTVHAVRNELQRGINYARSMEQEQNEGGSKTMLGPYLLDGRRNCACIISTPLNFTPYKLLLENYG
jgi:hypothetical protein